MDDQPNFSLFQLTGPQIDQLCVGHHHSPIDRHDLTDTGVNPFQSASAIHTCLPRLKEEWALTFLTEKYTDGRASFTLTPEFEKLCREQGITIPFSEIGPDTYDDNIERLFLRAKLEFETLLPNRLERK